MCLRLVVVVGGGFVSLFGVCPCLGCLTPTNRGCVPAQIVKTGEIFGSYNRLGEESCASSVKETVSISSCERNKKGARKSDSVGDH